MVRRRHDPRTGDWLDRGFLWDADLESPDEGVSVYAAEAWPTVDEQELGSRYISSRFPRFNYSGSNKSWPKAGGSSSTPTPARKRASRSPPPMPAGAGGGRPRGVAPRVVVHPWLPGPE